LPNDGHADYGRHSKGEKDDFQKEKFLEKLSMETIRSRVVYERVESDGNTHYFVTSFSQEGGYYMVSSDVARTFDSHCMIGIVQANTEDIDTHEYESEDNDDSDVEEFDELRELLKKFIHKLDTIERLQSQQGF
ncbi:hypothetical protein BGZ76_004442, partial [Entomortierella beljakovae]